MRLKPLYLMLLAVLVLSNGSFAQNCDPWIVQIYKQLYNRTPSAEECNIRNYNNGSWNNYDQLVSYIKAYNSQKSTASTPSPAAANCDPWIVQIYKQLYGRGPSAEECNIRNYNGGSWSSYEQLTGLVKNYVTSKGGGNNTTPNNPVTVTLKGDPWIFQAYKEMYGRDPIAFELNKDLYNKGSWGSYEELKKYVREYNNAMKQLASQIQSANLTNGMSLVSFGGQAVNRVDVNGGRIIAAGGEKVLEALKKAGFSIDASGNVVSAGGANAVAAGGANVVAAGGGNVVSAGGANVVAAGGANVVSAGGANVVSAGGANVVAAGGMNLTFRPGDAGLMLGSSRTIQSGGTRVVPISGGNALIISTNTSRVPR